MDIQLLKKRFNRPKYFDKVDKNNLFLGEESLSGEGSSLDATSAIRGEIISMLEKFTITSVLDLPCGDLHWMKTLFEKISTDYTGADISKTVIKANKKQFPTKTFIQFDICKEVPKAHDLIICRDLWVHLPFEDAMASFTNFQKSGSKYLLTTTFVDRVANSELHYSNEVVQWRPLNLSLPPFNFPSPELLINEQCIEGEGKFSDKCLALYDLSKFIDPNDRTKNT